MDNRQADDDRNHWLRNRCSNCAVLERTVKELEAQRSELLKVIAEMSKYDPPPQNMVRAQYIDPYWFGGDCTQQTEWKIKK